MLQQNEFIRLQQALKYRILDALPVPLTSFRYLMKSSFPRIILRTHIICH